MRERERAVGIGFVVAAIACGDRAASDTQATGSPHAKVPASASASSTPATSAPASTPATSAPAADPLGGYVRYEDKAGGYSIMLPGKPAPAIETPVERNGKQVVEHTVPLRIGSSVYSISWADGVAGPELTQPGLKLMLEGALRQTFADLGATLDATVDVQNGDHAGLEGLGTHPTQGKVRARVFELRTKTTARQYRVVMMGDQPDDVAKAVLDSFTIKP